MVVSVKNIMFLIFFLMMSSCSLFNRYSFEPCESKNTYQLIDTSSYYLLSKVYYTLGDTKDVSSNGTGMKFYRDGKVGFFHRMELGDIKRPHPRASSKGIYCIKDNGTGVIEFRFWHVQSNYFLSKKTIHKIKGDTIITYAPKTAKGGGYYSLYVKQKLPKEFLKFQPNW